jgi:hypothetical protein
MAYFKSSSWNFLERSMENRENCIRKGGMWTKTCDLLNSNKYKLHHFTVMFHLKTLPLYLDTLTDMFCVSFSVYFSGTVMLWAPAI